MNSKLSRRVFLATLVLSGATVWHLGSHREHGIVKSPRYFSTKGDGRFRRVTEVDEQAFRDKWEQANKNYNDLVGSKDLHEIIGIDSETLVKGVQSDHLPSDLAKNGIPMAYLESLELLRLKLDVKAASWTLNNQPFLDYDKILRPLMNSLAYHDQQGPSETPPPVNLVEVQRYRSGLGVMNLTLVDEATEARALDQHLDRIVLSHPYPVSVRYDRDGEPRYKMIIGYGLLPGQGLDKIILPPGDSILVTPAAQTIDVSATTCKGGQAAGAYFSQVLGMLEKADATYSGRE